MPMPRPDPEPTDPAKARILIIENNERVRHSLVRGLSAAGYEVFAVVDRKGDLLRASLRAAPRFRPHVAIVDLRLTDDHDTSDTSGLELLVELKNQSSGLKLIVYSAYLDSTVDREISKIGAAWIEKSGSPQLLKDTVADLARSVSANFRQFSVNWPDAWNIERTLKRLFSSRLPGRLADDVLAQLFHQADSVHITHIEGKATPYASPVSRGRSLVVKAQPAGYEVKKVVKLAHPCRIQLESANYAAHIQDQIPGVFHTVLERSGFFWDIGASVYTFLGDAGGVSLMTYRDYYQQCHNSEQRIQPLQYFFSSIWRYARRHQDTQEGSIVDEYDRMLGIREKIANIPPPHNGLREAARGLVDPVQWMADCSAAYAPKSFCTATIHGDFHADNLFTDGQHLWLVDFERTGVGPAYADFCELEIDVLTRLLSPQIGLADFRVLVDALLADEMAPELPADLPAEATEALAFIRDLRALALASTACADKMQARWELLFDCIFVAGMSPAAKGLAVQRDRAWLYAAALCTHIEPARHQAQHSTRADQVSADIALN